MSADTSITVTGNLTADPELRVTPASGEAGKVGGVPVATFTIASTPRVFDAASKKWRNGEILFLAARIRGEAAQNAAASLRKGNRVVASGVLKPRTYETRTGERRTVIELVVEEIGLSLRFTAAMPVARSRGPQDETPNGPGREGPHPAGDVSISAREYADDDPWFGIAANPAGHISVPGAEPVA